jgi:hypothetical protein
VGDTVVLSDIGFKRDERTLTEIKHRAVHALHQTMERFEEWFPGEPGIVKVAVRHDAGGHVDLSDVQKVLYAVKERADQAAELVQRRSPPGGSPVVLPAREGGDRARRSRRHTSF